MKDYMVEFMFKGLPFHERTRVYNVNNRSEAIQAVKNHYGSRAVKIISAKTIKNDQCKDNQE
ncbi:hypothetical protein OCV57_00245 [Hominimerdicola aceti]|uniref:Uncharacterized protein n=1 Tax=Hominimerdicola aceti TaxID=2981726 RepID=A0AAE3IHX1_9FIRM|nr:hypothetical protein [Hominimerdicola aceti]MCU6704358.1 hypothetical protein [Hominimerdicola aceti]